MKKLSDAIEVYLQPGDFYFGDVSTRIRTLLGSCVSITAWHPQRLIGGMCHYLLPSRDRPSTILQGKYADEAMQMFLLQAKQHQTRMEDYEIKVFGGANMFPQHTFPGVNSVAVKNIEAALVLLAKYDLVPVSQHLGLSGHRIIIFDISSGNVWMRYHPLLAAQKTMGNH